MFRLLDARRRRNLEGRTGGFTLIEVMVALGILVLVTAALYPQIVAGLRATGTARDITQAKGVAQAKLEQMRSMPFYVGREAGDYIDILDTYYRNTSAAAVAPSCSSSTLSGLPPTTWTGYVSASATHCPWEPAGPLYRKVINPVEAPGLGAFSMVVSTQFLAGSTPPTPVAPLSGYNSQTEGSDAPPSSQVGVTVAVFFRSHNGTRYTSTYTQVERASAMDPLVVSEAKTTTVHVSSTARNWSDWFDGDVDPDSINEDQPTLLADMGVLSLTGELFTGSRAIANVTGAAGATSLPSAVTGATTNLVAPVDVPSTGVTRSDVSLPNGCRWICFGSTRTDGVSAFASSGTPNVGSAVTPVRALIPAGTNRYGFWFDNGRWRNRLRLASGQPMVSLDTAGSSTMVGVRDCVVGGSGSTISNSFLTATGYLTSTPANAASPQVASCATAQANTVRVFPTSFAPNGVLRITLTRASAYCAVRTSGSNTATSDYLATVQYWNGSGYSTAGTIRPSNTTDPLDLIDLNQVVDSGTGLTLGDFVSSWSSAVGGDVERVTGARRVTVAVPAVMTLVTGPTRTFNNGLNGNVDGSSAISISLGAVSCIAGDYR